MILGLVVMGYLLGCVIGGLGSLRWGRGFWSGFVESVRLAVVLLALAFACWVLACRVEVR